MFTGLVEYCGIVRANHVGTIANRLEIQAPFENISPGESIAVQGVCLTALADMACLTFDVSPETLARTTLGRLKPGDKVNLERAMQANGRFGGHYVSGHVDTTLHVISRCTVGEYIEMIIGGVAECDILYLLPKGSITLDGVSLTINAVKNDQITVLLVPHTIQQTTLGDYQVNDLLNVEFDYLAKMVAHQVKRVLLNTNSVEGKL